MLPPEIDPFALAHIDNLDTIRMRLIELSSGNSDVTLTGDEVKDWMEKLRLAGNGFDRFRVCMADEVKQKERYRQYARENGYPFS